MPLVYIQTPSLLHMSKLLVLHEVYLFTELRDMLMNKVSPVCVSVSLRYRKSGNFRCKNIFVVNGGYEN